MRQSISYIQHFLCCTTYSSVGALRVVGVATAHQDQVVKLVGGVSVFADDLARSTGLLDQMMEVVALLYVHNTHTHTQTYRERERCEASSIFTLYHIHAITAISLTIKLVAQNTKGKNDKKRCTHIIICCCFAFFLFVCFSLQSSPFREPGLVVCQLDLTQHIFLLL